MASDRGPRRIEILMVDDDLADIEFTRDVLAEHRIANRMTVLTDGNSAWHYLRRDPPFDGAVRPDLLLLDLNLPGIDGLTLLDLVRADAELRDLKVAVLTTAPVDESILRRRGVPAHCFLLKPVDFDRLVQVVRQVDGFHLQVERPT
ncbi:response regulator [Virgisporangium ochraceum]|uniref:Two-component system response regulator n=1 Tax=Virgisporangium ochraceum TaxID=65505 RepID=A0A8J4A437_9ACTN|nr:response regulator [Virgisporangium ochraceum]GIJ75334.1 two-component system response regulator [Virgisporangium ochraceum]